MFSFIVRNKLIICLIHFEIFPNICNNLSGSNPYIPLLLLLHLLIQIGLIIIAFILVSINLILWYLHDGVQKSHPLGFLLHTESSLAILLLPTGLLLIKLSEFWYLLNNLEKVPLINQKLLSFVRVPHLISVSANQRVKICIEICLISQFLLSGVLLGP